MSKLQKVMCILGFSKYSKFRRWVGGTWYYCWVQTCFSHMWFPDHTPGFVERLVQVEISAVAKVV